LHKKKNEEEDGPKADKTDKKNSLILATSLVLFSLISSSLAFFYCKNYFTIPKEWLDR
jgi:hypothetical protein